MGMRATAGLHRAHLPGPGQIGNIKNTQATKTRIADFVGDALQTAVHPAARLLDGHDEQVVHDRDVALTTRAHDRRGQIRLAVVSQRVNIEAVIAARHHDVVTESDVRIGKTQQGRAGIGCLVGLFLIVLGGVLVGFCHSTRDHVIRDVNVFIAMVMSVGLLLSGGFFIGCCLGRRWQKPFGGQVGRVGGVVEPWRFGECGDFAEIPDGLFGIIKTGSETSPRVVR